MSDAKAEQSNIQPAAAFNGMSGSVTVVTRITKGYAAGIMQVEMQTLNFSNGELQSVTGGGSVQVDLLR